MQQPDLQISSPILALDPEGTRQMAAYTAKIQDIFRDVYDNLRSVKIVTSAPTAAEILELLDTSEVVILHHATQTSREVYYKYQGTAYKIVSA